jgi:hypothetical protein
MKKTLVIIGLLCSGWCSCHGALMLGAADTAYTINFDTTVADVNNGKFAGTGFQPNPAVGQLGSDSWAATGWSAGSLPFGGTQITPNTDCTRGTSSGGVTTGGIYAFDVGGGNTALGIQPAVIGGRGFSGGSLRLKVQNTTGATVHSLTIGYVLYVYNDTLRATTFNFAYSADDAAYTTVSGLDVSSAEATDTTPTWVGNNRGTTISGLTLADGGFFYLRWNGADAGGNGSARDEFALDDISVIAAVPEPAEWGLVCALGLLGVCGMRTLRERFQALNKLPEAK